MRFVVRWNGRIMADATFYGLMLLAIGLFAGLVGSVWYYAPAYDACQSAWANVVGRASSLDTAALPLLLGMSVIAMAGLALMRQWWVTRRVLRTVLAQHVSLPSRLARAAADVGLAGRVDCIASEMPTPFCYGFLHPRVCVPRLVLDLLDDRELRAVLRHEAHHVRNYDPLKIWLSQGLARGLYFLPLARDLRDSYLTAKEIAADETTTDANGDELSLASALLKMLAFNAAWNPDPTAAIGGRIGLPMARLAGATRSSANVTEERVRRLIDGRPMQPLLPSATSLIVSALVVIAIFVASYSSLSAASVTVVSPECTPTGGLLRSDQHVSRSLQPMRRADSAPVIRTYPKNQSGRPELSIPCGERGSPEPSCNALVTIHLSAGSQLHGAPLSSHEFLWTDTRDPGELGGAHGTSSGQAGE